MNTGSFLRRLFGNGTGERRVQDLLSLGRARLGESGEYASLAIARDALAAYRALDERAREAFFEVLAREFSPAPDAVARVAAAYQNHPSPEKLVELQAVVEPVRQELFRRLNMAPGGTEATAGLPQARPKGLRPPPRWKGIALNLM